MFRYCRTRSGAIIGRFILEGPRVAHDVAPVPAVQLCLGSIQFAIISSHGRSTELTALQESYFLNYSKS